MSLLSHQSYANITTPLWLSNPVPELVLDGTPKITLSNDNGVLNINGTPLEDVSNWYQYSASNGIILMGDPLNPDNLQAVGGNLYFNGELLAQAGQISNVSDWSLYIAIQTVNMNNNAISNLSGINGLAMSNYLASNWSRYVALQNVDLCNFNLNNVGTINTSNVTGRNDLTISAYEPLDITSFADVNILAGGGNRGRVNITANSGLLGLQGEVRIVANGGDNGAVAFGGLVDISATTPVGLTPTLTSAIKFSAAGINSYAGAIPSIGSLAGYNFIYGTGGVNICAGIPSILPNFPTSTYIYGTGGVVLESGFGFDVKVKDSTLAVNIIKPDDLTVSNLLIRGRVNLTTSNQFVELEMVKNISFDSTATISGLSNVTMTNGNISNLSNLNNLAISNYLASNWSSFTALSNVNLGGCNISNVGDLQVATINGSAYPPTVPNWSTIPASQNVNMNNFSISNLVNINGIPYASGTNWSLYPALQGINMCNFNISNVSNIDLININGSPYNANAYSNWAFYPASQGVNISNFNISNITRAFFGTTSIRQGANILGSTTAGTETVQLLNSLGGTGGLRVETIAFQNNGGAVNDTVLSQVLDALSPPRMTVETNVSTGNTIAYLSDLPSLVSPVYDIYVAPNGNDTTGSGTNVSPYLTIGRALTKRATLSGSVEVAIQVSGGTYTESFSIPTNTYIVGVGSSEVRQPTNIVGTITYTGANGCANDITIDGNVVVNAGAGNVAVLNNVNITSGSGVVAVLVTTGNLFITESRVNSGTGDANGIVVNAGILTMRDVVVTHAGIGNAVVIGGTSTSSLIRQCYIACSSTSNIVGAIVRYETTATHSAEINFTRLAYGSATTDVGGNKCCIQFGNTASLTANVSQNILQCFGAVTGGTRIEVIQKTGAGTVGLTYGDNETIAPASFVASAITRSPMTRVDQAVYGCFVSTVTTTVTGANVPTLINHNLVEVNGNSVLSISGGNINLNRAGNYEVSTSIQFTKSSGGSDIVYFWFRINGVDVLRSGSAIRMTGNGAEVLGNVTAMISANAGDVLSVVFGSTDATLQVIAIGSQTTPMVVPAIPSCITNVKLLN